MRLHYGIDSIVPHNVPPIMKNGPNGERLVMNFVNKNQHLFCLFLFKIYCMFLNRENQKSFFSFFHRTQKVCFKDRQVMQPKYSQFSYLLIFFTNFSTIIQPKQIYRKPTRFVQKKKLIHLYILHYIYTTALLFATVLYMAEQI